MFQEWSWRLYLLMKTYPAFKLFRFNVKRYECDKDCVILKPLWKSLKVLNWKFFPVSNLVLRGHIYKIVLFSISKFDILSRISTLNIEKQNVGHKCAVYKRVGATQTDINSYRTI